ncbi:MAG: DUF5666 domain-containing protein [Gammaproteobacteria bacterium]
MNKLSRWFGIAGVAGAVLGLVVACGGGGGGGGFVGIDRLGVTNGTITGFGSIFVNGVEYSTTGADFDIDDSPGSQGDLEVGQQVTIEWSSTDDGVTRRGNVIRYDDTLEGPIGSIDLANQSLIILGQVVIVDGATSFDNEIVPRDLTGLAEGDVVKVSGQVDGNGSVRATRIDFSENLDDFEVRGVIESLDEISETFILNGLTVDYTGVLDLPDLANGLFVEVGSDEFDSGSGTLFATTIQLEDEGVPTANDGDDGEIEGYVTRFVSVSNFDVSGVPVTTNGQTAYEDGVAGDLAENVKVEVKGEVNASGVLVASKIEFKSGDNDGDGDDDSIDGRVAADVTAVNAGAGTLTLAGVSVNVGAETRYEDQTGVAGQSFGLSDISAGDYVEIRGLPGAGATLAALIVERNEANDEGVLRGLASAIANPNLSVLGVPVITDGSTQFRDSNGNSISAGTFFAAISNGSEVKVRFTQAAGTIVADEIKLEDGDD